MTEGQLGPYKPEHIKPLSGALLCRQVFEKSDDIKGLQKAVLMTIVTIFSDDIFVARISFWSPFMSSGFLKC